MIEMKSLFKLLHNKNDKINDHLRMLIGFEIKKIF